MLCMFESDSDWYHTYVFVSSGLMGTATVTVMSDTESCCISFVYGNCNNIAHMCVPILFEKSLYPGSWW